MDTSIIIINYNTKELIKQCIESVYEKTYNINFEVIVVDNASTDGSQQMIKDFFPKVMLIESPENLGFGRANNLGSKYAKGRHLFLLNSDTILINNAVKILSEYLDCSIQVGCCGGNLLNRDRKSMLSFSRYIIPSIFDEVNQLFFRLPEKFLYGKNSFSNHTNKPMKVGYITGADLMIRKSLFDKLNGFDSDFFMYYEECELQYRINKMGFKIFSVPYAQIIHLDGKSFSNDIDKLGKKLVSRTIFFQKVYNSTTTLIINILFFIRIIEHILFFILILNKKKITYWLVCYKYIISR